MPTPRVEAVEAIGPFTFRWPRVVEEFDGGWDLRVTVGGKRHLICHGLGRREVFGRARVHSVTWVDNRPQVEAAEADDYPMSKLLIGSIRAANNHLAMTAADLPPGYDRFDVVVHREAIEGPFARRSLAVRLREDDVESWAIHAWWQAELRRARRAAR